MLGFVYDQLRSVGRGGRKIYTSDWSFPTIPATIRAIVTRVASVRALIAFLLLASSLWLAELDRVKSLSNDQPAAGIGTESLAEPSPSAAETDLGCQQVIYNPGVDHGYGWTTYVEAVDVEEQAGMPHSPPSAFRMREYPPDSEKPPLSGDSDAIGQNFSYPNLSPSSFVIDYQLKYMDIGPLDELIYAFFEVDSGTGKLIGSPIFSGVAPNDISYHDQQWHHEQVIVDYAPSIHDLLMGKEVAIVFYTSTNDSPSYLDVLIDDVQVKICAAATAPTGRISGTVSQDGVPGSADGATIALYYDDNGAGQESVAETVTEDGGYYEFSQVPSLPPGASYQIGYVNVTTSTERLGMWAGPIISAFADGSHAANNNFDITNVELLSPTHEAAVTFPATFTWSDRGRSGETYDLCLSDPQTLEETCPKKDVTTAQTTLVPGDIEPGFGFSLDHRYVWYVRVKAGGSTNGANFGESYRANAITFITNPNAPPGTPPPPSGIPPSGDGSADWTVMVYIAGDNNLGDPNRYYDPSLNLQGQFASLKQLARNHANVNLVTLTDFYDDTGTEYCHLKSDGSQACQQLGEADTSDPMVLSDFISNTLTLFPATHTMLIISDHGHSIAGVAADETTSRSAVMSPDELRAAYQSARLDLNKLDVLFYNACLMGSFEAAYDASFFADYMVASADELWVLNIYDRLLPLLSDPITMNDPKGVASGISLAYRQSVEAIAPGYFISSAAYDLSLVSNVNAALSDLAGVLADELGDSGPEIEAVRDQVQVYDSSGNFELGTEDAFVDLADLAKGLEQDTSNPAIAAAASALSATLPSTVITSHQITGDNGWGAIHDLSAASGLSVFFPNGELSGEQPTLTNHYLNRGIYQDYLDQTEWDEFLRLYITGTLTGGPGRLESATRPVSGAMPYRGRQYLPVLLNQ